MNIYIKPELEKKLREEPSMSGLINDLLWKHYTTPGNDIPKSYLKTEEIIEGNTQLSYFQSGPNSIPDPIFGNSNNKNNQEFDDPTYTDVEEAA